MTRTYSTANAVIESPSGRVAVEDLAYESEVGGDGFRERSEHFLQAGHVRIFPTLHAASVWLWEQGAVFGDATILSADTLSDAERQPPK